MVEERRSYFFNEKIASMEVSRILLLVYQLSIVTTYNRFVTTAHLAAHTSFTIGYLRDQRFREVNFCGSAIENAKGSKLGTKFLCGRVHILELHLGAMILRQRLSNDNDAALGSQDCFGYGSTFRVVEADSTWIFH